MNNQFEPTTTVGAANAGVHVSGAPLTVSTAMNLADGLLLNEVEQRVVRVRPMSTPVDQITRLIGARSASSMVVDFYSVDTKPTEAQASTWTAIGSLGQSYQGKPCYRLTTSDDAMFAPTETILVPDVSGADHEGNAAEGVSLVLYVDSRCPDGAGLNVVVINAATDDSGELNVTLAPGTRLVRMGRAASELDMQTDQFEALPCKSSNNCQIFKAQVEQSTVMSLTRKEAGWSFSDQEEVAVMDMRLGMEKNFLFGTRARLTNRRSGDEPMLTEGIWPQAGSSFTFDGDEITHADLVSMMRRAFTGAAAGSNRKILVAGSGLIERINRMDPGRTVGASDKVTRWGIDFSEINSKFGTLYVVHSEVFDSCGHDNDGLILDPDYVTKYSFIPLKVESLDLKGSGVRNVDATVITEASCVVLRHPKAHIRVIGG